MFDDIPEDANESFECPECGCDFHGSVTKNYIFGIWECDTCEWFAPLQGDES